MPKGSSAAREHARAGGATTGAPNAAAPHTSKPSPNRGPLSHAFTRLAYGFPRLCEPISIVTGFVVSTVLSIAIVGALANGIPCSKLLI